MSWESLQLISSDQWLMSQLKRTNNKTRREKQILQEHNTIPIHTNSSYPTEVDTLAQFVTTSLSYYQQLCYDNHSLLIGHYCHHVLPIISHISDLLFRKTKSYAAVKFITDIQISPFLLLVTLRRNWNKLPAEMEKKKERYDQQID